MDIFMCTTVLKYIAKYSNLIRDTDISVDKKLAYVSHMFEYKYSAGVFQPDINAVIINLEPHGSIYEYMQNDDDFIELLKRTIVHESLHWLLYNLEGIWRPDDNIEDIIDEICKY